MTRSYSLAYLTFAPLSPPEAIRLAAQCGYEAVGLRALPVAPGADFAPFATDAALMRATRAALRDTGVRVFDVEIIRIGEGFSVAPLKPFFEVCAALGARAMLVAGDDPMEARLTASFAALCEAAAPYGLTADLEFMPWTKVPDGKTALRVVTAAAQPNGGILVDTLHAARSRTTPSDIAAIPASMLHYAQLCDAPTEIPTTLDGLLHTARHERLLPGHGGLALRDMFAALQANVPVSLELPNDKQTAAIGIAAWAQHAIDAARAVLEPA
jgi:sugar phosphate isomerase/epimerase